MTSKEKRQILDKDTKERVIHAFLDESTMEDGKRVLARGAVGRICAKFKLRSERTARSIWNKARVNYEETGIYTVPNRKGQCGRKRVYDTAELMEAVEAIPPCERGSLYDLAEKIGVSFTTMRNATKAKDGLTSIGNSVKPAVTEQDKVERVLYCADRIEKNAEGKYVYDGMYEEVHLDEKWFFITPVSERIYVTAREKRSNFVPQRKVSHKSHILKVMFLAANARPRYDADGNCTFDGKIGMWPFVEQRAAINNSKNRKAGTMETHCVSVTKDVYRKFVIDKVLPAIITKWPRDRSMRVQRIALQADNPHTHFKETDPLWVEAADAHPRFKFYFKKQPTRSPDTNTNDLGLFRSLQSKSWKMKRASNLDGLVENVQRVWDEYSPDLLNRIWLSHQAVMDEILKDRGDNTFDLPHIGKDKIIRSTQLPRQLEVSCEALEIARMLREI